MTCTSGKQSHFNKRWLIWDRPCSSCTPLRHSAKLLQITDANLPLTALPQSPKAWELEHWRGMSSRSIRGKVGLANLAPKATVLLDTMPLAAAPAQHTRHCFNVYVSAVKSTGIQIIWTYLGLHVCHGRAAIRSLICRWQSVATRSCEEDEITHVGCMSSHRSGQKDFKYAILLDY